MCINKNIFMKLKWIVYVKTVTKAFTQNIFSKLT